MKIELHDRTEDRDSKSEDRIKQQTRREIQKVKIELHDKTEDRDSKSEDRIT